jgi:adenylate kinase family enzyme
MPLKDYYTAQDKCHKIHGMGSIEEIAQRLIDTVSVL